MSPSPKLPGIVHVTAAADELYDHLAVYLIQAANDAVKDREVFHLALSGGSTPEPFYMGLATDPRFRNMPWQKSHVWMVDERHVPQDDPQSNYRMICKALLDHVPMRGRQKHPVPVQAENPAIAYEGQLREVFGPRIHKPGSNSIARLDFVLLGMGHDAHTASLFPRSDAIGITNQWISLNDGEHVTPPPRITMTYPLLNAARNIAVLVTGKSKAKTLRRVETQLEHGSDPHNLPITGINPSSTEFNGALSWHLDADAAG